MRNLFSRIEWNEILEKRFRTIQVACAYFFSGGWFFWPSRDSVNLENEKNGSNDFFQTLHVDLTFDDLDFDDVIDSQILSRDVIIRG